MSWAKKACKVKQHSYTHRKINTQKHTHIEAYTHRNIHTQKYTHTEIYKQ